MRSKRRLCVEVVGARNLESPRSVDAYCVVGLCDAKPRRDRAAKRGAAVSPCFRSATVTESASPSWSHVAEFAAPARPAGVRLKVQLFSEKNFFFDMFPSNMPNSSSDDEEREAEHHSTTKASIISDTATAPSSHSSAAEKDSAGVKAVLAKTKTVVSKSVRGAHDSDSDDVVTLSEDDDEEEDVGFHDDEQDWSVVQEEDAAGVEDVDATNDECLGVVEVNSSLLCKPSRAVTDTWYVLSGTRSGEVRIRTIWYERGKESLNAQERESLFQEHASHLAAMAMSDHYGFSIPESARKEWAHLRSYQDCREERRVEEWTRTYGATFSDTLGPRRHGQEEEEEAVADERELLGQLARAGIPRHLRERVYMSLSGAKDKQTKAGKEYYAELVKRVETEDTPTFRQIELDIERTFGHSGTRVCTASGRDQLRRILRAYSLRNAAVGYCQGLNFIVGFLMLLADEEAIFWLLATLCEDLYPGYYTPAMAAIQTDMLVLKQLITEELPRLDVFTSEVGLPLELLGSQWLLCLFTTTFPSDTAFRIFDCLFTEGSHFVFPIIMAHLRRLEPELLRQTEFQGVLSAIKDAENACVDDDAFIAAVSEEAQRIQPNRIRALREEHRGSVRDEMQRAERARAFNKQLAVVYQIPAFSSYAASLLRFFHEEAEGSSRSDVAFVLTLLCHGLVWLAEHSKHWSR